MRKMSCAICLSVIEKDNFNCRRCSLVSHLSCMLEWNKILRKSQTPSYFTCPICKIGTNMSVFNPKSGRYVYKFSRLGRSLTKNLEKSKNPLYILNLKTDKFVKRVSKLGKRLIQEDLLRSRKKPSLYKRQMF